MQSLTDDCSLSTVQAAEPLGSGRASEEIAVVWLCGERALSE